VGAGTALVFSNIEHSVAQSQGDFIQSNQSKHSRHIAKSSKKLTKPLNSASDNSGSKIGTPVVKLSQAQNTLPTVDPAVPPSTAPAETTPPAPSSTPPSAPIPAQEIPPPPPSPAIPAPETTPLTPAELNRLDPSPNLLQSPTGPGQVQTQTTQPLTLQQALELSRRNNRQFQVAILELQRAQSALREARAELFPTLGVGVNLIRQSGTGGSSFGGGTDFDGDFTGGVITPGTGTGGVVTPGTGVGGVITPGTGGGVITPGTGTGIGTGGTGTGGTTTSTPNTGTTGSGVITPGTITGTTGAVGSQLSSSGQQRSARARQVAEPPTTPPPAAGEEPSPGTPASQESSAINALTGTVSLNYEIFTSGRRSATINAAEEQVRFNELEVERLAEQLRLDVSNDYYSIQEADEQVRIARAAVENAQASLRDAQALERAGLGTRFDVLRAQVQVANEQQGFTEAVAEQRIARRQLAQRLSLPPTANVSAADPVVITAPYNRSLEESIVLAFQNRAELAQQLAQRNISRQQRRIALANIRPQVDAFVNYDVQDILNEGGGGVEDGYSVGARVNWTLFDGGASRARADQAEADIAIAETQFADVRNQIRFLVEQAFFTLQARNENTTTARAAVEQARESLRLARLRFQAGVGTQTDVIAAETDLTNAEGNLVTAIIGYNRALASLQREISNLPLTP